MNKILGLSGRKQSGKNTSCNFLMGMELISGVWSYKGNLVEIEDFQLNEHGDILIKLDGDYKKIDIYNPNNNLYEFLLGNIWPFIKNYSFGDKLKQICIELFDLTYNQCYGSDEDKNTFTNYKWSQMSDEIIDDFTIGTTIGTGNEYITAREFLQLFGTNVMRNIYDNIWVNACIKQIKSEQPELAVITDVRFKNEIDGIKKAGGKVIRLTRKVHNDSHGSETSLDNYKEFDAVIDNQNMDIEQQNKELFKILKQWDYLPFPLSKRESDLI